MCDAIGTLKLGVEVAGAPRSEKCAICVTGSGQAQQHDLAQNGWHDDVASEASWFDGLDSRILQSEYETSTDSAWF